MSSTPRTRSRHDYELYQAWEVWKARRPAPNASQLVQVATQNRGNVKTMARALYKQLRKNGWTRSEVVTLTTELIGLLTKDLRNEQSRRAA